VVFEHSGNYVTPRCHTHQRDTSNNHYKRMGTDPMSWERGRADIEQLIRVADLEKVQPSIAVANRLMDDARAHAQLAALGISTDPAGALQLSYDAARKSCAALLAVQGLRGTTRGGHVAVIDAIRAQFNDKGGVAAFGKIHRVRRRRNDSEYPSTTTPDVASNEAQDALDIALEAIDATIRILESGRVGEFRPT
jgi:hypothetical protein